MKTTPQKITLTYLVLVKAHELLTSFGWTQRAYARDEHDRPIDVFCDEARCFCLFGALARAQRIYVGAPGIDRSVALLSRCGASPGWNDTTVRTRDEVLAVLDRAIGVASR